MVTEGDGQKGRGAGHQGSGSGREWKGRKVGRWWWDGERRGLMARSCRQRLRPPNCEAPVVHAQLAALSCNAYANSVTCCMSRGDERGKTYGEAGPNHDCMHDGSGGHGGSGEEARWPARRSGRPPAPCRKRHGPKCAQPSRGGGVGEASGHVG